MVSQNGQPRNPHLATVTALRIARAAILEAADAQAAAGSAREYRELAEHIRGLAIFAQGYAEWADQLARDDAPRQGVAA